MVSGGEIRKGISLPINPFSMDAIHQAVWMQYFA